MKYKYLDKIPKPLLDDFVKNKVIPLVGAGFSKNADIPDGLTMPDWNELGKLAAEQIPYEYDNDAIDALSYYEQKYTRQKLVEFLENALHIDKVSPGSMYEAFCNLFTGTICTTNFDSLIEAQFSMMHRPFSTVVSEDRLTTAINKDCNIVIKLHGDFTQPSRMVITEKDYDLYLDRNPILATYVSNLFISNTMLLLGYSLDDVDFRSIWQVINSRLGGMAQAAYCITVGASPAKIERYRRRNIIAINIDDDPKNYRKIYTAIFKEIYDYVAKERDRTAKSSDEKVNEQLVVPETENNLCFISCAMSRISRLSKLLYPTLRACGVTPVRIDDMLMPGSNWVDVSRTLIRKSKMAIVDISDNRENVALELGMILTEKDQKNVLVIMEDTSKPLPFSDISGQQYYKYSFVDDKVNNTFLQNIITWSSKLVDMKPFEEAHRLYDKGEYSACVVSAFAYFEDFLFKSQITSPWADRFTNDSAMLLSINNKKECYKSNLPLLESAESEYFRIRYDIVHKGRKVTRSKAWEILTYLEQKYADLQKPNTENNQLEKSFNAVSHE